MTTEARNKSSPGLLCPPSSYSSSSSSVVRCVRGQRSSNDEGSDCAKLTPLSHPAIRSLQKSIADEQYSPMPSHFA